MTSQRIACALLSLLLCLCVGVDAKAQQSQKDRAYELYKSGVEAFRNEEFRDAADALEQAAKIHRNAIVYYNLSLAYWKLDRKQDALAAAKVAALMEDELPPRNAARNRARIAAMETELAGQDLAADLATRPVAVVDENSSSVEPPQPQKKLTALGWSGFAGATIGAALLTTTLALNGRIAMTVDDYDEALEAGDAERASQLYDKLGRQQTTARAAFFSGAALVGVGVGMALWDVMADEEPPTARVSAAPVQGGAALDLRVRF